MRARSVPPRVIVLRCLAGVCAVLAILTLAVPDWIEVITGWDPDSGSGAVEAAVVAVLVLTGVASGGYSFVAVRRGAIGQDPKQPR